MGRSVHRLVLSGYYGFKNSGDEAVLQSILMALRTESEKQGIRIEPVVLSSDPKWTESMYGVTSVHRMKLFDVMRALRQSHGLISGGGSLLQDATGRMTIPYYLGIIKLAQWLGKPTFIYSQGIGPVHREAFFHPIRRVFERCRYVSVRDAESAGLLRHAGYSKEIDIVPDPVMGLPLKHEKIVLSKADVPVIGVSVRYWKEDRSELEKLAQSLNLIRQMRDVEIRFLPFHLPVDEEASREVLRLMGTDESSRVKVLREIVHPQDMLAEVSSCDMLMGMRLHSLIYAASQNVPMAGISYDPKIDQFLRRLEMKPIATTEDFDVNRTAEQVLWLLDHKADWMAEKRAAVERLKEEAQRPAEYIAAFLHNER